MVDTPEHGFYKNVNEIPVPPAEGREAERVPEMPERTPETLPASAEAALQDRVRKWKPEYFLAQKEAKTSRLNETAATFDSAAERTIGDTQNAEQALRAVGQEFPPEARAKVDAEIGTNRDRAGAARGESVVIEQQFTEFGAAREQAVEQIAFEVEKKDAAEGSVVEALNREVQKLGVQVEKLRAWEEIAAKRKSELAKLGKSLQGKVGDDLTRKEGDVANTVAKLEAQQTGIQGSIQKHEAARQVLKNLQRDIRL